MSRMCCKKRAWDEYNASHTTYKNTLWTRLIEGVNVLVSGYLWTGGYFFWSSFISFVKCAFKKSMAFIEGSMYSGFG